VALRRWRASTWALILPALGLLPVYAYRAEVSARLMWWTRRFLPVILPGLVMLIASALAAGLAMACGPRRLRWPVRAGTAVAAGFLLVVFAGQSIPLHHHQEHGGSFQTVQRIASAADGRQGVFLWEQSTSLYDVAYLFGGPVWLQQGLRKPRAPSSGPRHLRHAGMARDVHDSPVRRGPRPATVHHLAGRDAVSHVRLSDAHMR
jgi:hypothetical protein